MGRQPQRDVIRLLVTTLAIVAGVVLLVGGLAVVGVLFFFVYAMSNFGSNK
ncbi:hypothetical protein [Actinomadura chokoriensis]|uniref:Uncharacterized protein n=1 Tax=Actinomadura chokoriensis TaxID=454156 RepID=A0ABV4R6B7_9ACTN